MPPATYFEKIQAVLARYDVLLIADEVICGFGRTGQMWGSQTFGMTPGHHHLRQGAVVRLHPDLGDAGLRADLPGDGRRKRQDRRSSATASPTPAIRWPRRWRWRRSPSTRSANIVEHVRSVAPVLQDGLRRYADHPLVGEVRGVGLVAAVELVRDKATKLSFEAAHAVAPYLAKRAEANGLILRALPGDVIAFSPPLIIGKDDIEDMLARFGRALEETFAWARRESLAA